MKIVLVGYVVLMALALIWRPAPVKKGPDCGPAVLCIRTQKEVRAALPQVPLVAPLTPAAR